MVLENSVLMGLIEIPTLRAEFPPFAQAYKAKMYKPKRRCCGQSNGVTINFNSLRSYLALLPDASKSRFKQIINQQSVTVSYRSGGQVVTITF